MKQDFQPARAVACLGVALFFAGGLFTRLPATTLEQLSLNEMIEGSTFVVRAKVVSASPALRHGDVYTFYKLDVLEQWKNHNGPNGPPPEEVAVPGGVAGGIRQIATGAPEIQTGQEYVLFLWQGKSGLTQLMGLSQGLFRVQNKTREAVQAALGDQMLDSRGRAVNPAQMTFPVAELRARVTGNRGNEFYKGAASARR